MGDSNKVSVPKEIQEEYKELVNLILNAESMSNVEKEHWVNVLPSMNDEQKEELKKILEEEKRAIEELKKNQ